MTTYKTFCNNHGHNVEMDATITVNGDKLEVEWNCWVCKNKIIQHIIEKKE